MTLRPPFPDPAIRFGTRGSALALAQTNLAIDRFRARYPDRAVEIEVVYTEGDIDKTSPLTEIGGRGVFTSAIEAAILTRRVDAAIHSAKDLPSVVHPAVPIVAYPSRDDPRDVLVSRHGTTLDRLPPNPVIGTSSRRREVQIRRLRADAEIVNIRGNIDTRLRKAEGRDFDAIVLAAAGIYRLGWEDRICEYFAVERLVPSPGQGAIAIQARAGSSVADILETIDEPLVSTPVSIERGFLAAIGAGCTYPVGAYAEASDGKYRLLAMVADPTGDRVACADESLEMGEEQMHAAEIASRLEADVGQERKTTSWNGWSAEGDELRGARIVVTRPRSQAGPLIAALTKRGAVAIALPMIRVEPIAETALLDAALNEARYEGFEWIVFTSANAVEIIARRLNALDIRPEQLAAVNVAAVGRATATAATAAGFNLALVPESATGEAVGTDLGRQVRPGARVLYPRSAIGREALPNALKAAGLDIVTIDVYRTVPEPEIDTRVLDQVRRGEIDMITFTSPSSVRNFVDLVGAECAVLETIPVVCGGPVTGQSAREAGMRVAAISDAPDAAAMTEAIAACWLRPRGRRPSGEMVLTMQSERSAV